MSLGWEDFSGTPSGVSGAEAPSRTEQQNGSYRFVAGDVKAAQAATASLPMTSRCVFCQETFVGTQADGLVWGRAHRMEHRRAGEERA